MAQNDYGRPPMATQAVIMSAAGFCRCDDNHFGVFLGCSSGLGRNLARVETEGSTLFACSNVLRARVRMVSFQEYCKFIERMRKQ